jgi:hypothetical protein
MEFMTGMYEFDASGETERMSMRGSGRFAESSGELSGWAGCTRRLISRLLNGERKRESWVNETHSISPW